MSTTFGYTEKELNGMAVRTLYPDNLEYMRVGDVLYNERFGGKKKGELKVKLVKKDGISFDALLRVSFISQDNDLMKYMKDSELMIIAIVIDLVELKSICEGYLYAEA
jgi:PAS domain S-box-containing protein